jgi:hypothetical protein
MFKDHSKAHNKLELTEGGWGVAPLFQNASFLSERTETDNGFVTGTTPSGGFALRYVTAKADTAYMTGVTTGAASDIANQGLMSYVKQVAAGTDLSTLHLSDDVAAFPKPTVPAQPYGYDDSTYAMDRVFVSSVNDGPETAVAFNFVLHSHHNTNPFVQCQYRIYFCGPAGVNSAGTGTGQYALENEGTFNGWTLFEKLTSGSWVKRWSFSGPTGHGIVVITKSKVCRGQGSKAGFINFTFAGGNEVGPHDGYFMGTLFNMTIAAIDRVQYDSTEFRKGYTYNVPGDGTQGATVCKLRLDLRRDIFGSFGFRWGSYPTEAVTAFDAPFALPFFPATNSNITISWFSCVPTGTSLLVKLFNVDTESELSLVSSTTYSRTYTLPAGVNYLKAQLYIKATQYTTPRLKEFYVTRNGVLSDATTTQWEVGDATHQKSVIRKVSVRGAERDMSQNTARFELADPLNKLTALKQRGGMHVRIRSEYDPADPTKMYSLFRGIVDSASFFQKQRTNNAAVQSMTAENWGLYSVTATSYWKLLEFSYIDTPILSLTGPDNKGLFVTDMIKTIISYAGFDPTTEFDFPSTVDVPIRFEATDPGDFSLRVNALEHTSDIIKSWLRDYLQEFLVFDDDLGKWSLKSIPSAPFTYVAGFTLKPPLAVTNTNRKLINYLPTYDDYLITIDGTDWVLPFAPIMADTMETRVKPPEANWILVASIGAWNLNVPSLQYGVKTNPVCFGPTADPTHVDYLPYRKPIYVIDKALASASDPEQMQRVIGIMLRRLADLTFHSIKLMSFRAPIVLVDHETLVGQKRMLRYYDPVLVDGVPFLVRSVNPDYVKDGIQYAQYELEAPRI